MACENCHQAILFLLVHHLTNRSAEKTLKVKIESPDSQCREILAPAPSPLDSAKPPGGQSSGSWGKSGVSASNPDLSTSVNHPPDCDDATCSTRMENPQFVRFAKKSASRKRATKACLKCRRRKVRCDVTRTSAPCTNCRLDGDECVIARRGVSM